MTAARMTGDEYIQVLIGRQQAWMKEAKEVEPRLGWPAAKYPPLLEWFIRDGDEDLVDLPPDPEPRAAEPKRAPRPRRAAAAIRSDIAAVEAQMSRLGRPLSDDPAAARLSDARVLRRYHDRMDRDLAAYTRLTKRLDRLRFQLASAEAREAQP